MLRVPGVRRTSSADRLLKLRRRGLWRLPRASESKWVQTRLFLLSRHTSYVYYKYSKWANGWSMGRGGASGHVASSCIENGIRLLSGPPVGMGVIAKSPSRHQMLVRIATVGH